LGITIKSTKTQVVEETVPMMTLSCIHAAAAATVFWTSLTFSGPKKGKNLFCFH